MIVSEPIGDLPGVWSEVPEASYCVIGAGTSELRPFVVEPGDPDRLLDPARRQQRL